MEVEEVGPPERSTKGQKGLEGCSSAVALTQQTRPEQRVWICCWEEALLLPWEEGE